MRPPRTRSALTLAIAAGVLAALAAAPAAAQDETHFVDTAVASAIAQAETARDLTGWGVTTRSLCLIGGHVELGGDMAFTVPLRGGREYLIVGAGDEDVDDLDLDIASDDGEIDDTDIEDDATPWVYVAPDGDCRATITMTLEDTEDDVDLAFGLVIILESGRKAKGSLAELKHTIHELTEVIRVSRELVEELGEGEADLAIDTTPGAMSVVAGLTKDGYSRSMTRKFEADIEYAIVGWSDQNARDMDISVAHADDPDEIVAMDVDDDATPSVNIEAAPRDRRLKVTLEMFSADRPAFAAVAVLETIGLADED